MKGMVRGGLTVTVLTAAMAAAPTPASANAFCRYEPTVLPLPAGFGQGGLEAADGNDWYAGWLAPDGSDPNQSASSVGRWHNGAAESLGTLPGAIVDVQGINASGVVVGAAYDGSSGLRPVVHRDGAWATLPAAGPASQASDVNSAGDIVGVDASQGDGNNWNLLVVWQKNGARKTLTPPSGGLIRFGEPKIDDDGTVVVPFYRTVGNVTTIGSHVYPSGAVTGTALAPLRAGDGVYATDIRGGRIVGENYAPNGVTTGVQWDRSGAVQRTIPGRPSAVSQSGAITGTSLTDYKAAVWQSGSRGAALPGPPERPSVYPAAFSGERVAGVAYGIGSAVPVVWDKTC